MRSPPSVNAKISVFARDQSTHLPLSVRLQSSEQTLSMPKDYVFVLEWFLPHESAKLGHWKELSVEARVQTER